MKNWKAPLKMAGCVAAAGVLGAGLMLAGCASNSSGGSGDSRALTVDITDDSCTVSAAEAPSGTLTFTLNNKGTAVNEFEILAEDKLQIVSERENLTPGTTTELTVALEPGTYYTASKTNMVGELVGAAEFTVTDSGEAVEVSSDVKELQDKAVADYTAYIKDQAGTLKTETEEFAKKYKAGDTSWCKDNYALIRMHYERIEPTAEAFGDIDPAIDEREADASEDGYKVDYKGFDKKKMGDYWTGWHAIEKDLWQPKKANYSDKWRDALADYLVKMTDELYDLVTASDFKVTLSDVSNGAIDLLEEVATSKITGEEEAFSHTDLYDFQANVEGAKVAFGCVKPLAKLVDESLVTDIETQLKNMEDVLAKYNTGSTENPVYPSYTDLDKNAGADQTDKNLSKAATELSDAVNALRTPLAKLTSAVLEAK